MEQYKMNLAMNWRQMGCKKFWLYFFGFYFLILGLRFFTTAGEMNLLMQQGYQALFALLFALVCALWNFNRRNTMLYLITTLLWTGAALCKIGVDMVLSEREIIHTIGVGVIFYGLSSALLYALSYINCRWLRICFKTLILIAFALSMLPALLVLGYYVVSEGHLLSSNILLTLFQTNLEEVKSYLVEQNIPLWIAGNVALIVLIAAGVSLLASLKRETKRTKLLLFTGAFLLYMVLGILPRLTASFVINMITTVSETVRMYRLYNDGLPERMARLSELEKILSTTDDEGLYVVVMGESNMRDHMSAFGYKRPTTPWLDKMVKENPYTYIYPKAYSNNIQTVMSVQFAFTEQNQYEKKSLLDSYSVTEMATAAGFDTWWISNQKRFNTYDTPITAIANSANHRIYINNYIGTKTMTTYYDEKLADYFPELPEKSKNLLIFHLMGCHAVYIDRYPAEFQYWSDGDDARVDAYDNNVRYNDYVLSKLYEKAVQNPNFMAFIYLSDHGEDPDRGLTHDYSKFTWEMAHIPFFAIFSEQYVQKHPDIVQAMKQHQNSFWTSDLLYQTILHIMGIENVPNTKPETDISSMQYNMPLEKLTIIEGAEYIKNDNTLTLKN